MQARLFSYGGSGLKFLTNFLDSHISLYDVSHAPHAKPNKGHLKIDKIVFLYADPRNALLSFHRRDKVKNGWIRQHMKNLESNIKIKGQMSMTEVIEKDGLGLDVHFREWLNFKHPQIAFVKYESLHSNIKNLLSFLDLDESISSIFCKTFSPRISDYRNIDVNIQTLLHNKYKGLLKLQNSLPDFYIREDIK